MNKEQPVSMEPVATVNDLQNSKMFTLEIGAGISRKESLYTAAQIAAARQQGAEEERKESRTHHAAWLNSVKRIADLEKSNAELQIEVEYLARFAQHDRTLIAEAIRTQTDLTLCVTDTGYKLLKLGNVVAHLVAEKGTP